MCERRKTHKYTFETDICKYILISSKHMARGDQEVEGGLNVPRNACNETYSNQEAVIV